MIVVAVSSVHSFLGAVGTMDIASWKQAGLLGPSIVRPVVATISTTIVLRKLGKLGDKDQVVLRALIPTILG